MHAWCIILVLYLARWGRLFLILRLENVGERRAAGDGECARAAARGRATWAATTARRERTTTCSGWTPGRRRRRRSSERTRPRCVERQNTSPHSAPSFKQSPVSPPRRVLSPHGLCPTPAPNLNLGQALALHPDKRGGAVDAFVRVQRAWEAGGMFPDARDFRSPSPTPNPFFFPAEKSAVPSLPFRRSAPLDHRRP